MLPMFWDDTHHALAESTQRWVNRHISPHAAQWEEDGLFDRGLYRAAGAAGILGVTYPEAVGGAGGDVLHGLIVGEALVRGGSVGTAMGLGSHAISLPAILALGSAAQKARWAPSILSGEQIACLGITEPGTGSDVAGIITRAVRDGDHYIVNGAKTFITSGCRADVAVVAVRTGPERHAGVSLMVIERGTPGFTTGKPLKKMGWWASDTGELFFEDCRVPAENLLGGEGAGFLGIMANFVTERLLLACTCVAMAKLALEAAEVYVKERTAFGRPLEGFQVTRHRLAEMATREAAARAFVSVIAERFRRGEEVTAEVAMVKNTAVEACSFVTDAAVQIFGGMGYMRESLVERLYRDARLFPIGGGTTEIMRELISRRR
ncbi:MAG: acyl-CoA dehydrogenase family protein [Myxococcota bacterium]|nr:acyl-CoA dehydrogenase family protein [Myxococcota bacterium]